MKITKRKKVYIGIGIAIIIYTIVMIVIIKRIENKETSTNLTFELIMTKEIVKTLKLKLEQTNQKITELESTISKKHINKFSQSKPTLTDWVFKNSSRISKKMAGEIVRYTLETNFPLLLLSIMKTECTFDPTSVSSEGALGLGQVMPRDYEKKMIEAKIITEIRDIFDIPAGVKSIEFAWNDKLIIAKGDIIKALELYLGKKEKDYINQILKDFLYLNYLYKKSKVNLDLNYINITSQTNKEKLKNTQLGEIYNDKN